MVVCYYAISDIFQSKNYDIHQLPKKNANFACHGKQSSFWCDQY